MFDYHVHTTFSFDAVSTMEECARAAVKKGLGELCFTDHYEPGCPYAVKSGFDFGKYFREAQRVGEAVPGITIKTGIEAALTPEVIDEVRDELAIRDFDFVIASQHAVDGRDPWYGDYFDNCNLREGHSMYLEELLMNIRRMDDFDVIGHIGYIDKYLQKYDKLGPNPKPFTYPDFPGLFDDILRFVIERGKGIEVNTSNYYVHGYPTPHPSIIKRYAEMGGEIATTGSDSHIDNMVGGWFAEATSLMRDCGLKYVCTYTKRKPEFHKL